MGGADVVFLDGVFSCTGDHNLWAFRFWAPHLAFKGLGLGFVASYTALHFLGRGVLGESFLVPWCKPLVTALR